MAWLDEYGLYVIAAGFVAVPVQLALHRRERHRRQGRKPHAILLLPDGPGLEIVGESALREALKQLNHVPDGQSVRLSESPSHYLEAVRRGEFWSASLKTGSVWTSTQFTAAMTSEYSDRIVKERRQAGSVWKQLARRSAQPEEALSTRQVEELLASYLTGRDYLVPTAGAD